MVAGYFNDMLPILQNVYLALKPSAYFFMVLGDSAPYGVHIHTEEYLETISKLILASIFRLKIAILYMNSWVLR